MKLFPDCGGFGQCYTCGCGSGSWGRGDCLAGIGDDDYCPINLEEAQRRLDCSFKDEEKEVLLKYINTLQSESKSETPKDDCMKFNIEQKINFKDFIDATNGRKGLIMNISINKKEPIFETTRDDCNKCEHCKESHSFLLILDATEYYCEKYSDYVKQYHRNNPTGYIEPCRKCKCDNSNKVL